MRNLLKHPAMIVLLTICAVLYYLSLNSSAQKAKISSKTVALLEEEVDTLEDEVTTLGQRLESANHSVTQEKMIRDELLMQKPGEYILQLPPIEEQPKHVKESELPTPWQEWREILF